MKPTLSTALGRLEADLASEHTSPEAEFIQCVLSLYDSGLLDPARAELALQDWRDELAVMQHHVNAAARCQPEMLASALEAV
ncbi:MAG: hypothetical protein FJW36_11875 [Acidobacteria bacterium]|nr:hypothetical protein [Acidobacteriota bacterium]